METTVYGVIVIAVIIGIIQVAKSTGLPTKYAPLASTLIGLVIGITFLADGDIKKGIILGIACGLSACGMYDVGKELMQ